MRQKGSFAVSRQAEIILDQALAAQSAKSQSNTCAEASRLLLSTPSLRNDRSSALDRAHRPRSSSMRPLRSGPAAVEGRGSTGSRVTYRAFLERLTRQESKGFVRAIRLFLFSILGNGGDVNPIGARPRASADRRGGLDTEDVEVYGSSFLVQRWQYPSMPKIFLFRLFEMNVRRKSSHNDEWASAMGCDVIYDRRTILQTQTSYHASILEGTSLMMYPCHEAHSDLPSEEGSMSGESTRQHFTNEVLSPDPRSGSLSVQVSLPGPSHHASNAPSGVPSSSWPCKMPSASIRHGLS